MITVIVVVQQKMRKLDCSQFENLRELISIPKSGEKCDHNNPWSEEDPIKNEWIYSKNAKIAHTNFVIPVERKVYYRKTTGSCDCINIYNGECDMLLPTSKENPKLTKESLPKKIHLTLSVWCPLASWPILPMNFSKTERRL